uniref:Tc1-like transposase DDE domain-containing protein n=1 Tax=Oncorhynchus tshawytscha TaxID=74940 RepID=A0AAZ3P0K5_ONCTS
MTMREAKEDLFASADNSPITEALSSVAWRRLAWPPQFTTMTQHTSRLCKGYLTKKEIDGVLHQMTWSPQPPDLNPIEMVWDDLNCRVKEKKPTTPSKLLEKHSR